MTDEQQFWERVKTLKDGDVLRVHREVKTVPYGTGDTREFIYVTNNSLTPKDQNYILLVYVMPANNEKDVENG